MSCLFCLQRVALRCQSLGVAYNIVNSRKIVSDQLYYGYMIKIFNNTLHKYDLNTATSFKITVLASQLRKHNSS
jgi:hypothetical protein